MMQKGLLILALFFQLKAEAQPIVIQNQTTYNLSYYLIADNKPCKGHGASYSDTIPAKSTIIWSSPDSVKWNIKDNIFNSKTAAWYGFSILEFGVGDYCRASYINTILTASGEEPLTRRNLLLTWLKKPDGSVTVVIEKTAIPRVRDRSFAD